MLNPKFNEEMIFFQQGYLEKKDPSAPSRESSLSRKKAL